MPRKGEIKDRIGEKYITNEGYKTEIIEYFGALNCTVKFNDEKATVLKNIFYDNIKRGSISNPNHVNKYNGYIGQGKYASSEDGVHTNDYKVWQDMLKRVYSEKHNLEKPTYKDVGLSEEWHNFQNFAKWFEENYVEGWQLDKDIICPQCKIYSPETCAFVPPEINGMFTSSKSYRGDYPIGVIKVKNKYFEAYYKGRYLGYSNNDPIETFNMYKNAKEKDVKEKAELHKDRLKPEVYEAMINYQVLITD